MVNCLVKFHLSWRLGRPASLPLVPCLIYRPPASDLWLCLCIRNVCAGNQSVSEERMESSGIKGSFQLWSTWSPFTEGLKRQKTSLSCTKLNAQLHCEKRCFQTWISPWVRSQLKNHSKDVGHLETRAKTLSYHWGVMVWSIWTLQQTLFLAHRVHFLFWKTYIACVIWEYYIWEIWSIHYSCVQVKNESLWMSILGFFLFFCFCLFCIYFVQHWEKLN